MLNDNPQRQQATDPRQSFIVQAPAGSGKTEILTQRFLRLLSGVNAPEQIIALTFTRKAANEMRERILLALQQAAKNTKATSSHQQQTLSFAEQALIRDKALNWQLIQQPSRLRVITIDSLCQTLTQAIPLQEKQLPYAQISDKPYSHYLAAARACFSFAVENTSYHTAIKTLLRHVDNRQDKLIGLFSDLLADRSQWLGLLYQAKEQDKKTYEQALAFILEHELSRLRQSIPKDYADELVPLARRLAIIENKPNSPRYPLCNWESFSQLDSHLVRNVAALLLTSQNTLRKAFDHHVGLKRGECDNAEYDELKAASKTLFGALDSLPDFLPALLRVKELPEPHYDAEQWDVLQALFTLLPVLAAHLHVVFSEHNEVDFTAISEQALQALGDDESPTDLALYLDNSIHHLLVDEFQDTSIQQFQLLNKLVHGWQHDDGRTLFVVGDPMQSIYRFRSAEVGLFLRAKEEGIGPVHLTPLELSSNFRSTATIVDWVNNKFNAIFPQTNDIESGAVRFHPSINVQPADNASCVMAFQYKDKMHEAKAIAALISTELQTHPSDEIAILVRSRRQLTDIMRCLRAQKIPFQGVDIDLLARLPHLRDIWSLTQALLMPANRLAWLSLLRSPWCGLSLADVHCIAQFSKHKSIYFALSQLIHMPTLSDEGRLRAQFVYTVLEEAFIRRHQQSLIDWITTTLKHLHLEMILSDTEQDDLEQYWRLLERFEQHGQLADMGEFSREFNKLYSQQAVPSRLQIMTIHKSKGLEFDCIILPGLSTKPPAMDTPMLRWLTLPSQEHEELLLLSPVKAAHHEHCLLYDYLGKLDAQKSNYEIQRLLYVAATRAKKRLYLFDNSDKLNQGTFRQLLQQQEFITPEQAEEYEEESNLLPSLYHLPIEYYQQPPVLSANPTNSAPLVIANNTPRLVGIVTHELLQWVCDHHPSTSDEIPWELASHQLRTLGFETTALQTTLLQIQNQLLRFFEDPIGQWLIKAHEDEPNEYELLVGNLHGIATKIIDRTFCENGVRWIIDFKTGHEDQQTQMKHRQQVNEYAQLFANRNADVPIRGGIYYLENNHWVTWEYVCERKADTLVSAS